MEYFNSSSTSDILLTTIFTITMFLNRHVKYAQCYFTNVLFKISDVY